LTIVGTIRKNKTKIDFVQGKRRAVGSSLFVFEKNCTLVFYVPKKGKNVLLISTMHDDANINPQTNKPEIIMTYNSTKGGVDTVDKLCATYNCARGTNRWPMVLFYSLMNISAINTFIIYTENNQDSVLPRKIFLQKLSYALMESDLKRRAACQNLPRLIRERLIQICDLDQQEGTSNQRTQPGRCSFCGSKKNRKTKYNCQRCKKYFCLQHAIMICQDCYVLTVENN